MSISIFIDKSICTSIIWWINIDTFHLFFILLLQQLQRLKIFGTNQQTIALFIDIINGCKQRTLELRRKEFRVEHKEGILLEKFYRQRHGISRFSATKESIGSFYLNLINSKQTYPLLALGIVGSNLGIKTFGYTVERDAIVGFHDKLFFSHSRF